MMNGMPPPTEMIAGKVQVVTTSNGGHSPEFFAERVVSRLISVADTAPDPIKAQALAFRDQMHAIVLEGIKRAIASDRAYQNYLMIERGK